MIIRLRIRRTERTDAWGRVVYAPADEGSALALTLAFLAFFSIVLAVIFAFADTGFRTTMAVRGQREISYAVDASVEGAIQDIREDPAFGRELTQPGAKPCPSFSYEPTASVNNVSSLSVTCQAIVGSGNITITRDIPTKAIIALSEDLSFDGPGVLDAGTNDLSIFGDVVANSQIKVAGPGEVMTVTGVVLSPSCVGPGTLNTSPADQKFCTEEKPGKDPNYPPASTTVSNASTWTPATCVRGTGSRPGTKIVTFSPGRFPSADTLNDLMNPSGDCNHVEVFWFTPGVYYFDFPLGDDEWDTNGVAGILGGTPTDTVLPPLINPPLPLTSYHVPFPGGCQEGEDPALHQGVQFIFGGSSHWNMGSARVELCPFITSNPDDQHISIYGVTATPPSPSNLRAQSGCILARVASPRSACAVLNAVSPNGLLSVHGTVYAPRSWLNLQLASPDIKELFDRGVVVRVIHIDINPSTGFNESPVSVPRASPPPPTIFGDRKVLFVARIAGQEKLTARVDYVDNPTKAPCDPPNRVCPRSWNIVR